MHIWVHYFTLFQNGVFIVMSLQSSLDGFIFLVIDPKFDDTSASPLNFEQNSNMHIYLTLAVNKQKWLLMIPKISKTKHLIYNLKKI